MRVFFIAYRNLTRVLACFFSLLLSNGVAQWLDLAPDWATASGIAYYVDPNGNDANDGSSANPWKTIRHAASVVAAEDTVFINPVTYPASQQIGTTTSGTASNPIIAKPL